MCWKSSSIGYVRMGMYDYESNDVGELQCNYPILMPSHPHEKVLSEHTCHPLSMYWVKLLTKQNAPF